MLDSRFIHQGPARFTTIIRTASLCAVLFLANATGAAAAMREEAVSYRVEGYEAQRRGDAHTALSFYQKAAALDPTYPTPHNDIGVLLEEQGRLEEALEAYRRALSLNPGYLEAHANLAMLYERMGRKEEAVYHWLKRYELGDAYDPWTTRAEERLVNLGVLKSAPGIRGRLFSSRRLIGGEFQGHAKTLEEFRTVTEEYGTWP